MRYDGITATYMKEAAARVASQYGGDVRRVGALSRSRNYGFAADAHFLAF